MHFIGLYQKNAGSKTSKMNKPQDLESRTITRTRPVTTPPAPRSISERVHEVFFIGILCLAQFLSLAAMNQTVAPLMILAEYFDIHDYGNLSWFSAAFSMTVGTFILPAGQYLPTPRLPDISI